VFNRKSPQTNAVAAGRRKRRRRFYLRFDCGPPHCDSHQDLRIALPATTSYGALLAFVLLLFMFFCGCGAGPGQGAMAKGDGKGR
jgi:hypothetical protein